MKIAILASGGLGLSCIQFLHLSQSIEFIATDNYSFPIIEYATKNQIPLFKGNPRNGKLYNFAFSYKIDVLFSINYLFIIEKDIINLAKLPINFHGSLLPKYRGRTPHVWSIINNEKTTGITAHIINEGCDTGDILLQEVVEIEMNNTGNDVLQKYVVLYPEMLKKILEKIYQNKLVKTPQNHQDATYFDKRTPEDGEIDWNWQKERIYNWVRAQAFPYPGAFTFHNGEKIIIDKIKYSNFGFNNMDKNGLILKVNNDSIVVKTQNGAIELESIRNFNSIEQLNVGIILGNKTI